MTQKAHTNVYAVGLILFIATRSCMFKDVARRGKHPQSARHSFGAMLRRRSSPHAVVDRNQFREQAIAARCKARLPYLHGSNRRLRGTRDDLSAACHAAQKLGGVACAGGGGRGAVASHVCELSLR